MEKKSAVFVNYLMGAGLCYDCMPATSAKFLRVLLSVSTIGANARPVILTNGGNSSLVS